MLPTPRILLLLLGAVPLIALAAWAPGLVWVAVVYVLVVLGLAISDGVMVVRQQQVEVERVHEPRLSLGAENLITLILANATPRVVRFTLRDEHPHEFVADATFLEGSIAPYDVAEVRYHLRPPRRGDYAFGDLTVRFAGPLGAVLRQVRYPLAAPVKVYPNILELRKYDLMARKGHLHELGLRVSRTRGPGGEFERLRDYSADDEFRRINWKATARRGKLIAAEYETERSQHVVCVLDCGRLMAPPVAELMRIDYAVNTALMLSYVAGLRGDHVGLLAFADDVRSYIAPRRGKPQFQAILEGLYNLQPEPVEANHGAALEYLARRQRRRALIVLFTDLATPETAGPLVSHLTRLARHHLPLCVTISDPFLSSASGQPPRDSTSLYQRVVAEGLLDERRALLDRMQRGGVQTIDVPADRLSVGVVNTYLRLKAQGRL
ncbi:DUF58 domain-containing protein [Candidatus Viridilinea mediisalina]|uniref:DUF58 domain-containing protein n=2 Tax=Candidatus Viridilinea mediisalina TaxID=2024553 RepID=A0A2A6RJ57_9CHLR|nr:DUF58 domain-containing protein [Candidatus Viridilinea mediisalina]